MEKSAVSQDNTITLRVKIRLHAREAILCKIYLEFFLCFASLFANLSSIINNFDCNEENRI